MSFKLAEAFVSLGVRDAGLKSGLGQAKTSVSQSLAGIGGAFGVQLGLAGALFGSGLVVKLGSDADEIQSKFEAVFKNLSKETEEFAATFANNVGRSLVDTKRSLSEFQDVLVPLGFQRKQAAELSKTLLELGTDLASFNNKSDEQAAQAVRKALLGEREMMKELGVAILESDVKLRLLEKGQNKLTGSALKQAKALVTLELIQELSADAMGDAIRTSGGFANRLKALQGAFKDLASSIGQVFTPVLADSLGVLTDMVRSVSMLRGEMEELAGVSSRNRRSSFLVELRNEFVIFFVTWRSGLEVILSGLRLLVESAKSAFQNIGAVASVGLNPFASLEDREEVFNKVLGAPGVLKAADEYEAAILANAREVLGIRQNMREDAAFLRSGGQGGRTDRAGRDKPIPIAKPTAGFFGFDALAKKIQEQTLKTSKPQERMVGLMEGDRMVQQRQERALNQIRQGIDRIGAVGAGAPSLVAESAR